MELMKILSPSYSLDPTNEYPLVYITMSYNGVEYRVIRTHPMMDYYEIYLDALLDLVMLIKRIKPSGWSGKLYFDYLPTFLREQLLSQLPNPPAGVSEDPRYLVKLVNFFSALKSVGGTVVVGDKSIGNPTGLYLGKHSSTYRATQSIDQLIEAFTAKDSQNNPAGQLLNS